MSTKKGYDDQADSSDYNMVSNHCYEDPKKLVKSDTFKQKHSKCIVFLSIAVVVLAFSFVAGCAFFTVELLKLKEAETGTTLYQLLSQQEENISALVHQLESVEVSSLQHTTSSVANLRQQILSTVDSWIERLVEQDANMSAQLTSVRGQYEDIPASSCATLPPFSPSGYYWVRTSSGSTVRVYCHMTLSCGGVTGGWTRVADLDMRNSNHQCPSGLAERTFNNQRLCWRGLESPGCSSAMFSTSLISYSKVCGRIIGYQSGRTEAFCPSSIDESYLEGISLTYGSPRQHIWSFAATRWGNPEYSCPCIRPDAISREGALIPSFVGDDYFCDDGHLSDLWDGIGCVSPSTCCSFNNPPWFHKALPQPTSDNIEIRACRNENSRDEDVAVRIVELFIR